MPSYGGPTVRILLPPAASRVRTCGSFCLRLPERNNFQSALQEQYKVGSGGGFFVGLLLILVAAGAAGLQVQTVVARWREYGILQALGFTPRQILAYYGVPLALVLASGVAIAALASLLLATISTALFVVAAGLTASGRLFEAVPPFYTAIRSWRRRPITPQVQRPEETEARPPGPPPVHSSDP
jgi:hypothetical protein